MEQPALQSASAGRSNLRATSSTDAQSSGFSRTLEVAGRAVLAAFLIVLVQSLFWDADVPLVLKLGIAALTIFACARPAEALLVVAGLTPLGRMFSTRLWPEAFPARITEAIVLAFLAGWQIYRLRTLRDPRPLSSPARVPMLLFGTTVAVSTLVYVTALQVWKDYPSEFIGQFTTYLATGYLTAPIPDMRAWFGGLSGYGFLPSAAIMLEGAGLFFAAAALTRSRQTLPRQLAGMIVAGAVGAGALSVVQVATTTVSTGDGFAALPGVLQQRTAVFINKVNSAGSYFVLVLPIALGLACQRRHRAIWLGASVLITLALWLSGSRAVILTALALLAGVSAWLFLHRMRRPSFSRRSTVGIIAFGLLMFATLGYRLVSSMGVAAYDALYFRWLYVETTGRMLLTRPLFGIGAGQYLFQSGFFSDAELVQRVVTGTSGPHENPHNYFLLIAGELGLIGFATFAWLIAAVLWPASSVDTQNRPFMDT